MSGPLSVPAAALALWVENETAKYLLGATAFVCLWATAYFVWKTERNKTLELEALNANNIQMKILDVLFDPNGPTEFYVSFELSNFGTPSTVEGWALTIFKDDVILLDSMAPRGTFQITHNSVTGGLNPPEDLSTRPLQTGEKIRPRFTWTYQGNAKEAFGQPGTRFYFVAYDIRGREISAEHFLP